MGNASYVTSAKPNVAGAIYRAALDSTLPTSAAETLDAAFTSLGFISSDGVDNDNSPETTDENEWGGNVVLTTQTSKPDTFKYTLIEGLNVEVLKTVYGDDNVSGTLADEVVVSATNDEAEQFAWVIDMILKGGYLKRIVIPQAALTEIGTISYKNDASVGYELTISAVPYESWTDSDGKQTTHKEYIKKKSA